MAIFLVKNHKNRQHLGLRPETSISNIRELHWFAQHATQLRCFSGKKDLPLGSSFSLNPGYMCMKYYF